MSAKGMIEGWRNRVKLKTPRDINYLHGQTLLLFNIRARVTSHDLPQGPLQTSKTSLCLGQDTGLCGEKSKRTLSRGVCGNVARPLTDEFSYNVRAANFPGSTCYMSRPQRREGDNDASLHDKHFYMPFPAHCT